MKPSTIIHNARHRIATPDKWTKGVQERDIAGKPVHSPTQTGVCWCLDAALGDGIDSNSYDDFSVARSFVIRAIAQGPTMSLTGWNDAPERTHGDVIDVLKRAEALALEAGQ